MSNLVARLAPLVILLVFSAATVALWHEQVEHQRLRLTRHTQDVTVQASRRLEIFVDSRLAVATIFAKRWVDDWAWNDLSHQRFEEFGALLIDEIPGYHSMGLVGASNGLVWVVPPGNHSLAAFLVADGGALLEEARAADDGVVSAPTEIETGHIAFFAALPLQRNHESLGWVVVEFRARPLIDDCFHERIRAEFSFAVDDGGLALFRYPPEGSAQTLTEVPVNATRTFPVRNRSWRLTVAPGPEQIAQAGWTANLPMPVFGFVLSIGLSWLVHLLLRRMQTYREARDSALSEVAERKRAENALRVSETRYRRVFDSVAEGLVVLDRDGRIVEANDAACTISGRDRASLVGSRFGEVVAGASQPDMDDFLRKLEQSGTALLESVCSAPDGRTIELEIRGTRFVHEGGPAALAMISDQTERRFAMRQQALLARKVLMAQEEERSRLSRELHDVLGQSLSAIRLEIDWLDRQREDRDAPLDTRSSQIDAMLESAAEELRDICQGLKPPWLDELGLESSLTQLVQEFQDRTSLPTSFDVDLLSDESDEWASPEIALVNYRVLQEALTNIQRHADARSVRVSVGRQQTALVLSVYDDGRGFDPSDLTKLPGLGIAGMKERAKLVNGSLEITSEAGAGTRIVLRVPVERRADKESP